MLIINRNQKSVTSTLENSFLRNKKTQARESRHQKSKRRSKNEHVIMIIFMIVDIVISFSFWIILSLFVDKQDKIKSKRNNIFNTYRNCVHVFTIFFCIEILRIYDNLYDNLMHMINSSISKYCNTIQHVIMIIFMIIFCI